MAVKPFDKSILALAAAAFAVVTTEFSIVGILPDVARDLDVSVPTAGLLVTLFAFTVALAGPFLTMLAGKIERRRLFVGLLLVLAAGNIIAALAENFTIMVIGRIIPALALPVFWSIASTSAARLAGSENAGQAISVVFYGVSGATILGMPLGALIADAVGWRTSFLVIAGLSVAMAMALAAVFPRLEAEAEQNTASARTLLASRPFLGHLALSGAVLTALFTAYTYLSDVLQTIGGMGGGTAGWVLMGFGTVGLLGNWLAGKTVGQRPMATSLIAAAVAALGMAIAIPALQAPMLAGIALLLWGVAQSASFVANHVRVIQAAPHSQDLAASLNVSVYNVGIGLGAIIGGEVIATVGLSNVGIAGGLIVAVTLAVIFLLSRWAPQQSAAPLVQN
ncbi:MAG: MFS transporter [Roseibium sp.]|uniref:MFS transporter n=1 Tax=Roseibium sp. TaxID=1936156 RepID=UPI003D9C0E72